MKLFLRTKTKRGFTLIEVMVVTAVVALLASIAIPNFVKSREAARRNACIKNLKTIDEAKHLWGIENAKTETATAGRSDLIGTDKYIKKMPVCPSNGSYTFKTLSETALCSVEGHSY